MFNFSKILPKIATNELDSPKIAIWAFVLFTALMTWRSIIHMLFESWGLHGIANFVVLTGDPDPMPVIYSVGPLCWLPPRNPPPSSRGNMRVEVCFDLSE